MRRLRTRRHKRQWFATTNGINFLWVPSQREPISINYHCIANTPNLRLVYHCSEAHHEALIGLVGDETNNDEDMEMWLDLAWTDRILTNNPRYIDLTHHLHIIIFIIDLILLS